MQSMVVTPVHAAEIHLKYWWSVWPLANGAASVFKLGWLGHDGLLLESKTAIVICKRQKRKRVGPGCSWGTR